METILHYFPDLTPTQIKQFEALEKLYKFWNEQINVISRKDTEKFYERHVLHSLGIAKIQTFEHGSEILDVGTGGGFPGIPLAILFPKSNFKLVDSIGKKIKVVNEVAKAINLTNIKGIHCRAEQVEGKFDFVISRAVTRMPDFIVWVKGKIKSKSNHERKNGILYLKGGDLSDEMSSVKQKYKEFLLSDFYSEDFFETKKVIHVVI